MALAKGSRSTGERPSRPPWLLALAVVACALAFGWLAFFPQPPGVAPTDMAAKHRSAAPPPAHPARVTLSVMTLGNELTPEHVAAFEAQNPDIHIAFFEYSANLLDILLATNDPTDVFRLGQVEHEPLVRRGLLYDITDRVARSERLSAAGMRERALSEVMVDGRCYGLLRISAIVDACFRLIVDGVSAPSWTGWGCAQARSSMYLSRPRSV